MCLRACVMSLDIIVHDYSHLRSRVKGGERGERGGGEEGEEVK